MQSADATRDPLSGVVMPVMERTCCQRGQLWLDVATSFAQLPMPLMVNPPGIPRVCL